LQRERTLLQIMIFSNSGATGKPSPEFCFRIKNTKDHKKIHCGGTFLFCSLIILHCLFKYMFRTRVIKMKIFVSFFSYYLYSGKSKKKYAEKQSGRPSPTTQHAEDCLLPSTTRVLGSFHSAHVFAYTLAVSRIFRSSRPGSLHSTLLPLLRIGMRDVRPSSRLRRGSCVVVDLAVLLLLLAGVARGQLPPLPPAPPLTRPELRAMEAQLTNLTKDVAGTISDSFSFCVADP
jgi:hypothetical protein